MSNKPAPLNIIWLLLILVATVVAAHTGRMDEITKASFDSAKGAVTLAIGLIGAMALWLGIMRVVEEAGLMRAIARGIRPVMVRLFPDIPAEHPAMSAMIMNIAANMLGLGNAATPMGIKAMKELDRLNPEEGTATNAMCLFLAINTSSVTLLPLGVITIRAAAGAADPAAILLPSVFATGCSTLVAITAAKLLARRGERVVSSQPTAPSDERADEPATTPPAGTWRPGLVSQAIIWLCVGLFVAAIVHRFSTGSHPPVFSTDFVAAASGWLIPILMCFFLIVGYLRGVHVYEALTEGAKEGFNTAVRIIPFMVAIFVAIGMIRASGAMDLLAMALRPILEPVGMPAEALPVALMRPLSGSGAFGLTSEVINHAPNSFGSFLVSTMQGSTETTFYVLAVYFGAIGIRRTRHALPAALLADFAGVAAALVVAHAMFRGG
ncbi:MAG: spore maturation protein [Chitinivibrionales bacterium]|nr:spore maturation protein [Chitinivibrionales bacterium]